MEVWLSTRFSSFSITMHNVHMNNFTCFEIVYENYCLTVPKSSWQKFQSEKTVVVFFKAVLHRHPRLFGLKRVVVCTYLVFRDKMTIEETISFWRLWASVAPILRTSHSWSNVGGKYYVTVHSNCHSTSNFTRLHYSIILHQIVKAPVISRIFILLAHITRS